MSNSKRNGGQPQVGIAQAVRDVLVAAMNKGQFPIALAGLIVLSIIWKMPPDDVSKLAFSIMAGLRDWYLVGYGFAGIATIGWVSHTKWQRKILTDEIARLSDERSRAQEKHLGNSRVKSSQQ